MNHSRRRKKYKPSPLLQSLEEVAVLCLACKKRITLDIAAKKAGWAECGGCHRFICPDCISIVMSHDKICPSSVIGKRHELQLLPLKVKEIVNFVNKRRKLLKRSSPLYKILYEPLEPKMPPIITSTPSSESEETRIKEEIWQKHGLVLTKRKKGKFVYWEKVIF